MLENMENMFDNMKPMMKKLKKKSYEVNTAEFTERNGHYFQEMTEYVEKARNKELAAQETAALFVDHVQKRFSSKKGKIDSLQQADLNFFMIFYVFPTILKTEHEHAVLIADAVCGEWGRRFPGNDIQYTDYDTLYGSFREKIFGIF